MNIMNTCNKPPVNMRRALKSPALRMEEGGSVGFATSTPEMQAQASAAHATNMAGFARQSAAFNPTAPAPAATQKLAKANYSLPGNTFSPMAVPQLRDGGEVSPWSMRGIIGNVSKALTPTPKTPEQIQHERDLVEYKARAAAARSAPAQQPAQAAPSGGISGYVGNSALEGRMKAAGLRDGGEAPVMRNAKHGGWVPGEGEGDKTRALLEKDEFVVSRDMLASAPGLREQLHDLRSNVLAAKGKSVEQADAEAVSYGGTTGEEHDEGVSAGVQGRDRGRGRGQGRRADADVAGSGDHGRHGGGRGLRDDDVVIRANEGLTKPPLLIGLDPAVANRAAEATRQAAFEADTLAKAKAAAEAKVQSARVMPANAGPSGPPRGYRTGQAAAGLLKKAPVVGQVLSAAAEAGDVAEVAMDKGSSKLDVATQTAEGVSKFAGATAGGLAGAAVGGPFAPLTSLAGGVAGYYAPEAATKALRWATGQDTSSPHERMLARAAEGTSPSYTPRPDSVAPWGNESRRQIANINAPSGNVRGAEDFSKALSTVPKDLPAGLRDGMVYKTKGANGETVYSGRNVSGDVSNRMLNGDGTSAGPMRGSLRSAAGAPSFGPNGSYAVDNNAPTGAAKQAQIDATLRNPDGSTWTARDNAVMAANLRDGVDPYRGTSRQPKADPLAALRAKAMDSNAIGHNGAAKMLMAAEQNQSAERVADAGKQSARAAAERAQLNDDRKYELDVARLGLEAANKNRDDKRAGEEAFAKRVESMIGDDKDGVVAARVRNGANVFLADSIRAAEAELRQNPGNAKAARDLKRLQDGGVGALDDKMISDLVLGQQGNAAAAEYAGMAPWSGKAVDTAAPIKSLKLKKGLLFDDYVSDSASGNQVIPARALEKRPDLKRLRIE